MPGLITTRSPGRTPVTPEPTDSTTPAPSAPMTCGRRGGVPGMPGTPPRLPHVMGADGAGVVESVGSGVTGVRPGDRVVINPGISDYTCEFCRAGEHSLCVAYQLLGEHLPGTMAELVTVPATNVALMPRLKLVRDAEGM